MSGLIECNYGSHIESITNTQFFFCFICLVYPSIGGWTLSNSFPAVAADPQKRLRFARECVGIIADYGFDGIVSVFLFL